MRFKLNEGVRPRTRWVTAPSNPSSELVVNSQGIEVGVKGTRQGGTNRTLFTIVVVVPVGAEAPVLGSGAF